MSASTGLDATARMWYIFARMFDVDVKARSRFASQSFSISVLSVASIRIASDCKGSLMTSRVVLCFNRGRACQQSRPLQGFLLGFALTTCASCAGKQENTSRQLQTGHAFPHCQWKTPDIKQGPMRSNMLHNALLPVGTTRSRHTLRQILTVTRGGGEGCTLATGATMLSRRAHGKD